MTPSNLFFVVVMIAGFMVGSLAYAVGQWIGFNQGRKSQGIGDSKPKIFDPGEQSADITDPYLLALQDGPMKPGEDTQERISTL